MDYFKYVFCILTYKNTEDIKECLTSIEEKVCDYKVVIVNSYFDDESKKTIKKIALNNNCDFINVPNKGYGAGNNAGIKYINENYDYEYIIISNPDIIIKKFDLDELTKGHNVIAPLIITRSGKNQNPYWLLKNSLSEYMLYKSMKTNNKFLFFVSVAINKLLREVGLFFFKISTKKDCRIYGAHGSFFLISKDAIEKIGILFDEKMFLFAEEALLAHEFEEKHIPVFLTKKIKIYHKEDGSVSVSEINENSISRESIIYYYEKLHNRKGL